METRLYLGKSDKQSAQERLQRVILQRASLKRIAQQMKLSQLKIDEMERRSIPVEELNSILVEIAAAISTRLRAQPSRLMERLTPHLRDESRDDVFALLQEDAAGVLAELKTMQEGAGTPLETDPDADTDLDALLTDADRDPTDA